MYDENRHIIMLLQAYIKKEAKASKAFYQSLLRLALIVIRNLTNEIKRLRKEIKK